MKKTCIHQVTLECTRGSSNKMYVVHVHEIETPGAATTYMAVGYYGAIGATLSTAKKYEGPDRSKAFAEANKLEKAKRKEYETMVLAVGAIPLGMPAGVPVFGGAAIPAKPATPTPAPVIKGPSPMLAYVIASDEELEPYMSNPDAVMQKKYDGERMTVSLRRKEICAYNRDALPRPIPATAMTQLQALLMKADFSDDRETVIDGEILNTGLFVAYDILTLRGVDVRDMSFDERFCQLEMLLDTKPEMLAITAWSEETKRQLLVQARAEDWEGLMVRISSGTYVSGRSKFLFKFKLWATATCRVLTINSKRSVQLACRNEHGDEVPIGNATVLANQIIPDVDSLLEVRYLYVIPGGSLYQPTILMARTDVSECDFISGLRQPPPEKAAKKKIVIRTAKAKIATEPA